MTITKTLELLSRCQTRELTELAIECSADDKEFALWDFLPRAFPCLTSFSANIVRSGHTVPSDIPVVSPTHMSP